MKTLFRTLGIDNDKNLRKKWWKTEDWWLERDNRWSEQTQTEQLNDVDDRKKVWNLYGNIAKWIVKTVKI